MEGQGAETPLPLFLSPGAATHLPTRPLTWHRHPGARSSLASTSWQIIFCKSSCPHHVPGLPVSQQKIHSDSQP